MRRTIVSKYAQLRLSDKREISEQMLIPRDLKVSGTEQDTQFLKTVFDQGRDDMLLTLINKLLGEAVFETHGLDTQSRVHFYEQDFYVLSNFSAFQIRKDNTTFQTVEHAYHWEKFSSQNDRLDMLRAQLRDVVKHAPSAHEAFQLAQNAKAFRRPDWDDVKVDIMRDLLLAKVNQHEYVKRKLLATGDRELVENSWRDDFWGWGPDQNGQNQLGVLWMEIRAKLREFKE